MRCCDANPGMNPVGHARYRDEQQNDQRGNSGRNQKHRQPAQVQIVETEAGQRAASTSIGRPAARQPPPAARRTGSGKGTPRQQERSSGSGRRATAARGCSAASSCKLPCQRQHGDHQRDEEIGASHRHGHRGERDKTADHRQLDIPSTASGGLPVDMARPPPPNSIRIMLISSASNPMSGAVARLPPAPAATSRRARGP